MRVLQQILSSRAGTTAALSVVALALILSWKVVSLATANAGAASYVAAAAAADGAEPRGASWQQEMALLGIDVDDAQISATSTDHLAMIGPMVSAALVGEYIGLQASGSYSASAAEQAADGIAANVRAVVPYKTYALADLKTDSDTSYQRMLTYRADLRDALAPLLQNTNAELELYAKFVETSDPLYLGQLTVASKNYLAAAQNAAAMTIPRDAVNYHIAILNAMQQFASVLDAMTNHTTDPLTNAALLRSYNQAEQDMYLSFNNLSAYYGQKRP